VGFSYRRFGTPYLIHLEVQEIQEANNFVGFFIFEDRIKNLRYAEMTFFVILFDASENFINVDSNYEFGINKCLCLFDMLQKTFDSPCRSPRL